MRGISFVALGSHVVLEETTGSEISLEAEEDDRPNQSESRQDEESLLEGGAARRGTARHGGAA